MSRKLGAVGTSMHLASVKGERSLSPNDGMDAFPATKKRKDAVFNLMTKIRASKAKNIPAHREAQGRKLAEVQASRPLTPPGGKK